MKRRLFVVVVLVAGLLCVSTTARGADRVLVSDDLARRTPGLITNQFAFLHPSDAKARKDAIWEVTSGSFFADRGSGFSGVPDDVTPNALSTNGSGSAIFHALTNENDIDDATVTFDLQTVAFFDRTGVPPRPEDGVAAVLR
ncbi:MAG: hypothetical protein JO347_09785, partial [Candidatus Eremiobacteraeota bacterium]|nr:hypothetical protein [Candidatus Eremiobacteraeota bacterium]